MFFLKHPTNGVKISFFDGEVKADEAEGWIKFDPWAKTVEDIASFTPSIIDGVVNSVSDVVDKIVEVTDKRTKKYKDSIATTVDEPVAAPVVDTTSLFE